MKNRSWYLCFLLFWLIPALACGPLSSAATATPTAPARATTVPKATATSGAAPKATATKSGSVKGTATAESTSATTGQFSPITFSVGVLNDVTAVDPLDTFPDGITQVYAVFDYSGLQDGKTWRTEWKRDGQVQTELTTEKPWKGGDSGTWWVSVFNPKGVKSGEWELDLYLDNSLQQSAKATVEANPAGQPDFGPITFAPDKDAKDNPVNPLSVDKPVLPAGTASVYAFFNGINVPKNTAWTTHWYRNGESAAAPKDHTWTFGPNEVDWISFGTTDNSALASGTYELKITIDSRLVDVATYIMP